MKLDTKGHLFYDFIYMKSTIVKSLETDVRLSGSWRKGIWLINEYKMKTFYNKIVVMVAQYCEYYMPLTELYTLEC